MSDPFLQAHQLGPYLFSIGGNVGPTISIRDQMLRGQLLVDRAIEQGLLGSKPEQRPLVVIGAGAGGASAALRAAQLGIPADLVDRQAQPFHVQTGCTTRWVDPVQYDWPMGHYDQARFPWPPPPDQDDFPLPWQADFADSLATGWQARLGALVTGPPPLPFTFHDRHDFRNVFTSVERARAGVTPQQVVEIRSRVTAQTTYLPAAMVLVAIGFGKERVWAGHDDEALADPARGYPFWDTDRWYEPNFGLAAGTTPRVLISGAGAGALQDFLRVLTQPMTHPTTGRPYHSARAIYDRLGIPPAIQREVQHLQEYAQRLLVWGGSTRFEHAVQQEWHDGLVRLVQQVLAANPGVGTELGKLLQPPDLVREVRLCYSCTHLTSTYGLNRFLTLLIAAFLEEHGIQVLFPQLRLRNLDCAGHAVSAPPRPPHDCWGQPHVAHFVDQPRCFDPPTGPHPTPFHPNILFLRHGVKRFEFETRITPPIARQMLPYSLPKLP
jgi:hypothetical protein